MRIQINISSSTTNSSPLYYKSLFQISQLIRSKQISPVELTQMMLERIAEKDTQLKSYATVMASEALTAAKVAEDEIQQGVYRSHLHGVPIAIKDLIYTEGVRTMGGLRVFADFVPTFNATVVSKLKQAGAIILGKLNLTEGAMVGYHPDFDIPVNPWDDTLWAGASSSGCGVATAAGLCFASLGTDTGGSIRFPAMANGLVGLKPTYGRVSRYGVLPLAESMDHVGPMTRTTIDVAIMLDAIAGFDPKDPTSLKVPMPNTQESINQKVKGLRIGYDHQYASTGIDPELVVLIEAALEKFETLGIEIINIKMPELSDELKKVWFTLCMTEAFHAHQAIFSSRTNEYGAFFSDFLKQGAQVSQQQYQEAYQRRKDFNLRFKALFADIDAIVCPAGGSPIQVSQELHYKGMDDLDIFVSQLHTQFTFPASFAGTPSLSLPCGFSHSGYPLTMQLMGSELNEALLCRIGHAYETTTEWYKKHPKV